MGTDRGASTTAISGAADARDGTTDAAVATWDLTKRFGHKAALDGVSLTLPRGSVTALVGPNGAGKTTLISVCLGFERPQGGHVEVDGVDPWKRRKAALRRVGYVPQTPAVYRGLNVDDHVAMAASHHPGFDKVYARKRLRQLDIPLGQRAETLSGGQAAQLGLAIALGTRAKVLLLDEPLANLDPLARREFIQVLLDAIRADGSTALLSSHIVTDVEEACDRLTILGAGRILLDCPLEGAETGHCLTKADETPEDATPVGSFIGRDRTRLTLWRLGPSARRRERASLEDVVLGYLAAGRPSAGLQLD